MKFVQPSAHLLKMIGADSRTDLAYYANLPADDVRAWTGGRARLEISALPLDARKQWLADHLQVGGSVTLDDGAVRARGAARGCRACGSLRIALLVLASSSAGSQARDHVIHGDHANRIQF